MFENHKVEKGEGERCARACVSRFILLTEHVYVWVFAPTVIVRTRWMQNKFPRETDADGDTLVLQPSLCDTRSPYSKGNFPGMSTKKPPRLHPKIRRHGSLYACDPDPRPPELLLGTRAACSLLHRRVAKHTHKRAQRFAALRARAHPSMLARAHTDPL